MYRIRNALFLLVICLSPIHASWRDDSVGIFLPSNLQELSKVSKDFSFFWKALYVIDARVPLAIEHAENVCSILKRENALIVEYFCRPNNFRQNLRAASDWVSDLPLREEFLGQENFQRRYLSQLALASVPGTSRELVSVLRSDPLAEASKLNTLKDSFNQFNVSSSGFLTDSSGDLIVIPFSFSTSPQDIKPVEPILSELFSLCQEDCAQKTAVLGPHAAAYVNQEQIKDDLYRVSLLGALFFFAMLFFLRWKRAAALLSLLGPLVISLLVALGVTYLIFGSIHGLTLAFGPSLVGLVLDYGIHTKIHRGSREAWSSNLFGLLTTLCGFIVLAFSEIPLLKQLMVFSLVGLLVSFVLYYLASQTKGRLWRSTQFEVFNFRSDQFKVLGPFALLLLTLAFLLVPLIKLDLNLKNFELKQKYQAELESKLWSSAEEGELSFSVSTSNDLGVLKAVDNWARSQAVPYLSWSRFIPSQSEQLKNLNSWSGENCKELKFIEETEKKFFQDVSLAEYCKRRVRDLSQKPAYVEDYVSKDGERVLQVLKLSGSQQKELLNGFGISLYSFKKIFAEFPQLLLKELFIMFPLTLLFCLLIIYFHTKGWGYTLLALFPMFSAVGLVLGFHLLFGRSLSFVSCVAMLMIFGSSVDYGIFKVDSLRKKQTQEEENMIFSSLFMNALLTFIGYLPLVFAKHPVLKDLGWVLSFGTIGAFLGGVWGVSFTSVKFKKVFESKC